MAAGTTYVINRSNIVGNGFPLSILPNTENTTTTPLTLIGQGFVGFGQAVADNFVHMLENFAGPIAPTSPLQGQLWFNSSLNDLNYLDMNGVWREVASLTANNNSPNLPNTGDLWFSPTSSTLSFWNGSTWVPITNSQTGSFVSTNNGIDFISLNVDGNTIATLSATTFNPNPAIAGFPIIFGGMTFNAASSENSIHSGNLIPLVTNQYDLGTTSLMWRNGFFSGTITSNGSFTAVTPAITDNSSLVATTEFVNDFISFAEQSINSTGTYTIAINTTGEIDGQYRIRVSGTNVTSSIVVDAKGVVTDTSVSLITLNQFHHLNNVAIGNPGISTNSVIVGSSAIGTIAYLHIDVTNMFSNTTLAMTVDCLRGQALETVQISVLPNTATAISSTASLSLSNLSVSGSITSGNITSNGQISVQTSGNIGTSLSVGSNLTVGGNASINGVMSCSAANFTTSLSTPEVETQTILFTSSNIEMQDSSTALQIGNNATPVKFTSPLFAGGSVTTKPSVTVSGVNLQTSSNNPIQSVINSTGAANARIIDWTMFPDSANSALELRFVSDDYTTTKTALHVEGNSTGLEYIGFGTATLNPVSSNVAGMVWNQNTSQLFVNGGSVNDVLNIGCGNPGGLLNFSAAGHQVGRITTDGTNIDYFVNPTIASMQMTPTGGVLWQHWILESGATVQATYADLAEKYQSDQEVDVGTLMSIGGEYDITPSESELSTNVFGIVSDQAGFQMNAKLGDGPNFPFIAHTGTVAVKCIGKVKKGDRLVASSLAGYARAATMADFVSLGNMISFAVIGRALSNKDTDGIGLLDRAAVNVSI